jgi:Uncharacterised nucleotidyltransferase
MQAAQSSLSENPALELLLLCTRRQIGADTSKRILAIASGQPDWNALLAPASEHALTSLVCKNLLDCAPAALPAPWRERFSRSYFECSCRNLALTAELFRVLAALESCGVSATPYKGPVLAAQAYGDVALREFSDLDIIVPQRQIVAAHEALLALGFCPEIAAIEPSQSPRGTPGQYAYRKGAGTLVELHTEHTLRYFPAALDLQALCTRRQPITLAGRQVLTFSADDTLLLLSVHGSKHLWDRLSWIADIAALTARSRPAWRPDWALVLERARSWRVQRMLLLGVGLAARLLEAAPPDEVTDCLRRDRVTSRMIEQISRRFLSAEKIQLGVLSRFAFRLRMRGPFTQGLPYAIRLALMPTELDRGKRRLPDPLYALLRPLRLARTYGWRTRVRP